MHINNQTYTIAFNFPWIDMIALPTSLLAGCYVYPAKLEIQCHNKTDTTIEWFKDDKSCTVNEASDPSAAAGWTKIGNGSLYLLTVVDVGHKLKVICSPRNGSLVGPSVECISVCMVEAGPGPCPFESRHMFTTDKLIGNKFRVVTYNLLADLYADSEHSRTVLFPYCPPYGLAIDYRKQLLIREILGYQTDLLCCQEVDSKVFDLDLVPLLRQQNYAGTFQQKGETGEGLATFWDERRFELVERHGITIGGNIEKLTIFNELWQKIKSNQKLVDRIVIRSTALQVDIFFKLSALRLYEWRI